MDYQFCFPFVFLGFFSTCELFACLGVLVVDRYIRDIKDEKLRIKTHRLLESEPGFKGDRISSFVPPWSCSKDLVPLKNSASVDFFFGVAKLVLSCPRLVGFFFSVISSISLDSEEGLGDEAILCLLLQC